MLILTGTVGQTKSVANLGETIDITVLDISGDRVRLCVATRTKSCEPSPAGEPEYLDIPRFLRKQAD